MPETAVEVERLRVAVVEQLSRVIDPETGVDVVRTPALAVTGASVRLIEDLAVDEGGHVAYTFRPSSALCPIAVPLALMIKTAVAQVSGASARPPDGSPAEP